MTPARQTALTLLIIAALCGGLVVADRRWQERINRERDNARHMGKPR